ncbi:MAG: hypothetical protein QOD39_1216 [Mycobacterium sp.]|nr:hypothetical protein [Mycobacterium sp.]
MPNNKVPFGVLSAARTSIRREAVPRASLISNLIARLRADKFDRLLAVGVPAQAGSALWAHEVRLTSIAEREAVARTLRDAVTDSRDDVVFSSRVPLHAPNVTAAEDMIDAITLRLHSPRPVRGRGMARLRRVLSDGCGPLYRFGRGDLNGRLGAALAAL